MADLILSDRISDANQKLIPSVSDLVCSWEVSRAGQLSCTIPARDLVGLGISFPAMLGKWLRYTHPTAGAWGGQLVNVAAEDGIVTINAESWASMLRGVKTTPGSAGQDVNTNLKRIIDANRALTGISYGPGTINIPGVQDALFSADADFYDSTLPGIVDYEQAIIPNSLLPYGYSIDPVTRVFSFLAAIGVDKSATVKLADKVHVTSSTWSDDTDDFSNYIALKAQRTNVVPEPDGTTHDGACLGPLKCKGKGKKKKCKCPAGYEQISNMTNVNRPLTVTKVALDQASINQYGQQAEEITQDTEYPNDAAVQAAANALLAGRVRNQQLVTMQITDEAGIYLRFREGDVVACDLSNSGYTGRMAVRHRAYNDATGIMTVAGEAELAA